MKNLHGRLDALEGGGGQRGPLLLSWLPDASRLATTILDGQRYTQEDSESRDQFLKRVAALMPKQAFVWIDQLDTKI